MKVVISTSTAPAAAGPYSQALKANGCLYVSGQLPLDPDTGKIVTGGPAEQIQQTLRNLGEVLRAAGCSFYDVVKLTIYTTDLSVARSINEVYGTYFDSEPPARSMVEVRRLPRDAGVEIDAIAIYKA